MDGLRPKKPKNNEFVKSGLEDWALVNQTNIGKDSDDKRMKRKKGCVEKITKSKEVCSFILLTSPITSLILECYFVSLIFSPFFLDPPSFILSLIFISTFNLYAKWLVLIPIPSTLPIGPHVVVVRLKYTVHVSLLY